MTYVAFFIALASMFVNQLAEGQAHLSGTYVEGWGGLLRTDDAREVQ